MSNAIQVLSSDNAVLATTLDSLEASVTSAARATVERETADTGENYTEIEKRSMTIIEALKLTNHVELASLRLRGRYIHIIRQEGLSGVHPGGYASLEAMAEDQGIGTSELSNTITLCDIVFPFLEDNNISVAEIWNTVRKSTFREMAPVLAALITGDMPNAASALTAVQSLLDEQQVNAVASGEIGREDILDEQVARTRAALDLINFAGQTTNRAVRDRLRPSRTAPINTVVIEDGEIAYVLMSVAQDQRDMLFRAMSSHVVASVFNTSNAEVMESAQPVRRILGL